MAALAMQNFNLSLDMVSSLDLGRLEEFKRTEDELDSLSSNAERVGDHLINVAKTIRALNQN